MSAWGPGPSAGISAYPATLLQLLLGQYEFPPLPGGAGELGLAYNIYSFTISSAIPASWAFAQA